MATRLSAHFRQRRFQLGLRLGEVARRMGYTSIAGAANKVILFEERGDIRPDLFDKLKTALEIDDATVERLVEEDRREYVERWNQWANQPIEPHLVIRAIPGCYINEPLPEGLESPDDMERYAAESAKDRHKKLWLVLSRRLTIMFSEDGTKHQVIEAAPGEMNGPYMQIGGSNLKFVFGSGTGIQPLSEPEKHGVG